MVMDTYYQNASEVRKNWSVTIDSVVHERPTFINRTHDKVTMMDVRLLAELLKGYKYHVSLDTEEDGSITGYSEELELVENAPTKEACLKLLANAMKDYAVDFYSEFHYWSQATNRISHIPYVLKLLISDEGMVLEDMECQAGKI